MGNNDLLQKLKDWRRDAAQKEGVELFRVLSNSALETIASQKPATKEGLLSVKGIKERKFEKYGASILAMIHDDDEEPESFVDTAPDKKTDKPFSVSKYLNILNSQLGKYRARIQGEISGLDTRERVVYFSLKDSEDESVINCLMWRNDYQLSGIEFEIGKEIILEGYPEVYKPIGRLSFKASVAELVGEGVLKKAYDELKKKLEHEGLFLSERKKLVPEFPQKIGLITSKSGAVIHDFLSNLGKYGYQIKFVDSRVEGQIAVRDLISALDYFSGKDMDIVVIIRGGGSYESLQAFNNEAFVRKIADMDTPVICGIGHDKDVPLASLAADVRVSTPTAVTAVLNKSWDTVLSDLEIFSRDLFNDFQRALSDKKYEAGELAGELKERSNLIFKKFELLKRRVADTVIALGYVLRDTKRKLDFYKESLLVNFNKHIQQLCNTLKADENRLIIADPMRQLRLGYSIASIHGKVVKSVQQVKLDSELDIQISDGKIKSRVLKLIK